MIGLGFVERMEEKSGRRVGAGGEKWTNLILDDRFRSNSPAETEKSKVPGQWCSCHQRRVRLGGWFCLPAQKDVW